MANRSQENWKIWTDLVADSHKLATAGVWKILDERGYMPKPSLELAQLYFERKYYLECLTEARLQIVYLHDKFKETGSGNQVVARLDHAIKGLEEKISCTATNKN